MTVALVNRLSEALVKAAVWNSHTTAAAAAVLCALDPTRAGSGRVP